MRMQSPASPAGLAFSLRTRRQVSFGLSLIVVLVGLLGFGANAAPSAHSWVGTWATAPIIENRDATTPDFNRATLRQVVRVSTGGSRARLKLSNAFGRTALILASAELGLPTDGSARSEVTSLALRFNGQPGATVPAGAVLISDPIDLPLPALADVAITLRIEAAPDVVTGHPGARATSWWLPTERVPSDGWGQAHRVDRWYFITGIDVETASPPRSVALLGDSITDGYGVKPATHQRWSDGLSQRLRGDPATADIGVLNVGIGGNRLLRDGNGPNVLARLERDVLAQTGVRWLVVLAGINDIGTRLEARKKGEPYASAADIIGALDQVITRARSAGIRVYGATITPYEGAGFYWSEDGEADRLAVNRWIRESGRCDAVIDFDLALRDPLHPSRLAAAFDSGDHLHPSMAGYAEMARVMDLGLFSAPAGSLSFVRP
ncbi:MAG: SGNH/GDSL hydrolase family protein [Opitutaceae bacterium]|nr:SGNH/GDSL hydrolase family protein [Opitutaceae bacterium]